MADDKQAVAGESIVSRWSRRKLEAEQAPAASEPADDEAIAVAADGASANQGAADKPLTDADMPDIDSLTETSDFSLFMSSGVSDELRNLALRKLFQAPFFNIRDGLDEYDEDYTSFEKLGDIVTCDMKHQVEMQQQKLREALERENEGAEAADVEAADSAETADVEATDSAEVDGVEPIGAEHDAEVEGIAADKRSVQSAMLDADKIAGKAGSDNKEGSENE